MQVTINSITQLSDVAKQLLASYKSERVFLFFGDMGVGKTTFIKSICEHLGITDTVSSPTYSIVNEYVNTEALCINHFDFYRLKVATEALDLGFEEYLDSNSYCFIEWPEKIRSYWPKRYVKVVLTSLCDTGHTIFAELVQE